MSRYRTASTIRRRVSLPLAVTAALAIATVAAVDGGTTPTAAAADRPTEARHPAAPAQALPSEPADGSTAGGDAAGASRVEQPVTVTLVTGDRVTLRPNPASPDVPLVEFRARDGRTTTDFSVLRQDGHVHVVPDDVAVLVPDVLDPSLFDVTALVDIGYDDANRDEVPLIVRRAGGVRTLDTSAADVDDERPLDSIDATAGTLAKSTAAPSFGAELAELAGAVDRGPGAMSSDELAGVAARRLGGIREVLLDRPVHATTVADDTADGGTPEANEPSEPNQPAQDESARRAAQLDHYLTQVKAPFAWDRGLDGTGVTVAVLDTGVDDGHPALAGQVDVHQNFTDGDGADDGHGHGTHVASLLAGTGAESGGQRQGIAPNADLLSGKVLDDEGEGLESWVIAGMEWAVDQGADIVNMSLGALPGLTDDPVAEAVDTLTAESGTLFVVAAGNSGSFGDNPFMVTSPGIAASALTVAAVADDDALAPFSSEGPVRGSYRQKPDVAAPGIAVLGARAGARDGDFYVPMDGTSMATPIVGGAAALLAQQHPNWTPSRIKNRLVTSADRYQYQTAWSHGGGRLDLKQATAETLVTDVGNVDFGYLRHPGDDPRHHEIVITNQSGKDVTLELTDEELDGQRQPAPDDAVTVTPSTVTVPAKGSATVTAALDPELVDDTTWQGYVEANVGTWTRLRLPLSFYDEPERYDVDIEVVNRAGNPDAGGEVVMFNGQTGGFERLPLDENGSVTARVGPGPWSIFARVTTPASAGQPETFTIAGSPEVDVSGDTTYHIDARDALPLTAPTVEGQQTRPVQAMLHYARFTDDKQGYTDMAFFAPEEIEAGRVFVTPTEPVDRGQFEAGLRWRLEPTGRRRPTSPDAYELLFAQDRFTDPLSPHLDRRDLRDMARVTDDFHGVGEPGEYSFGRAHYTELGAIPLITRRPVDVPAKQTELVTASPKVYWYECLAVPQTPMVDLCHPQAASHEPGERVDNDWASAMHPDVYAAWHSATTLFVEVGLGDGQHVGQLWFDAVDETTLTLYRDGEEVGSNDDLFHYFDVPPAAAEYTLVQDLTLKPEVFPAPHRAHTEWTFTSAGPDDPGQGDTRPPLLSVDYDAAVDDLGRAAPRRPLPITLSVDQYPGSGDVGDIDDVTLEYSLDGEHWSELRLRRRGDRTFETKIKGGVLRSGDEISLRVDAVDTNGNGIAQTVTGIVAVR